MRILDMPDDLSRGSWVDDEIAGPMGYEYCVLFDCARDVIRALPHPISLPGNICRSVYEVRKDFFLDEVDQRTGIAKFCPTHLYGYQSPATGYAVALDPLMTGWIRHLESASAIVSFGRKKMLSIGYGGAFLTNNQSLAEQMAEKGRWNSYYTGFLLEAIKGFYDHIQRRWEVVDLWDRYLGNSLIRIPAEQLMPWRVMRRAVDRAQRIEIVSDLLDAGLDVGINYPPLEGRNEWGDTVLNFFCSPIPEREEIQRACNIIKRAVNG